MTKLTDLITATASPINHNGTPAISNVQCIARAVEAQRKAIELISRDIDEWQEGMDGDFAMTHIAMIIRMLSHQLKQIEDDIV